MEGLLTPVSTSYKNSGKIGDDAFIEIPKPYKPAPKASAQASSPAEAIEILRSEPDHDTLLSTLKFLGREQSDFSITSPGPVAAQLVHILVSDTVPTYWNVLQESSRGKKAAKQESSLQILLSCLRSITGLNAVVLSLKQYIQLSKESQKAVGGPNIQSVMAILLQLLQELLGDNQTVETIWKNIHHSSNAPGKQKAIWNEFLGLVGNGKILGVAAEAEDIINTLSKKVGERYWIANGTLYCLWLARNVTHWSKTLPVGSEIEIKGCGELLSTSFRLGYTDNIVKEILTSLVLEKKDSPQFIRVLDGLERFEQRNTLYSVLKIATREFLSSTTTTEDNSQWWKHNAGIISAVAGLVSLLISGDKVRKNYLISWITNSSGAGIGDGVAIRRAVVASLAQDKSDMETILDKSLQQFGDQLYIKHTPTLQQEVHTQILLLSAGYVHRMAPLRLAMMLRSGAYLSAVSNRLAASSPRARFLGMVVGEALSSLVNKGDKKMDFKVEEMSIPEAKWYKSLVSVVDTTGSLEPLMSKPIVETSKPQLRTFKQVPKPKAPLSGSKIISIEEIQSDEADGSDDDGLVPYAKPDSDAEDSEEDVTLITRNKPTAPVYIRDLITYLRDTESYDKQKLALSTAAPLIRRKANFGTEVSAHAEELAALLVGLQDKYEIEDFQDMRLQGMIAILIALPLKMGQWFSKTFFDGDYSISQRASILTTLGIGARELGGYGSEDSNLTSQPLQQTSFQSKTLPETMHKLYSNPIPSKTKALPPTAVDKLSTHLSNTMIAPLAADLADKLSGPQILKIRTFSSRMSIEKKRKKPIANQLAKVVSEGFFFPLTGRFFIHLKAYGSSRSNVIFEPFLLALFVKTLALVIHASGPSTLSLPQMSGEFWDLLLGLRVQGGDVVVMEALLFAFLTILEVNEDKRSLVEAHGRQMLETQEWVEGIFGRLGSGGSAEDEKVRMLAAGVLVRIRECVEKYQALLMGDLASFHS